MPGNTTVVGENPTQPADPPIAHARKDQGTWRLHGLDDHLRRVSDLARQHAQRFDGGPWASVPTNRAGLLPMLTEGRADLAAGTITVTEGHRALVDFSEPFHTQVRDVLVTGPAAPEVRTAEDMFDSTVYLRPSTSFYEHLAALNPKRVAAGKAPFPVADPDENLTDEDLIEMVGAGIIPATIADDPVARLFAQVSENVRVREDLVLAVQQHIAWAMRKDSPKLKDLVDSYVDEARKGTKLRNTLLARYLKDAEWTQNALAPEDRERFKNIADLVKTYAGKYDFDWFMIAAQGYQESGLD